MKEFSDGLVRAGNKVVVVTPFDSQFRRDSDPFKIVTYKYIWPDSLHVLGYSQTMERDEVLRKRAYLLLFFLLLFGTIALFKTVKKEKVEIINVHWILPNGLMAAIVSRLTGVPYVVTLPGTDAYLAYRYKLFGFIAKWVAQNSSGIISNSSWHLNRILRLKVSDKRTDIISYPTDVSKIKPLKRGLEKYRKKHTLNKDNLVILAIGRLVYKKGFDYLIRAMPEIVSKYPRVRLLIGGDGDLRQDWEKLAKKLRVDDKILFLGNIKRDEIVYYYNLSDIMVAPSIVDKKGNVDGGPVVSFESMACGKPQIVTNVLGVADIIKDGVNGFIVPQRNSKAIARALEKLIKSKETRVKMGKANRKLISSELSIKTVGERYTKFFEQVILQNSQ
jgi:glycosyltransferase involved in cell wall biosynthesis